MIARDPRPAIALLLLGLAACNDPPLLPEPPTPPPVRDAMFRRLDDGGVYLIRTDGTGQRRVSPQGVQSVTPFALTEDGRTVALLLPGALAIAPLEDLAAQQVILNSVPPALGLSAFSADGRYLAVPCILSSGSAILLYDRSTQDWDTIPVVAGFSVAPAFSPDGSEIAGINVDLLTMSMVRILLVSRQVFVNPIGASRALNSPLFGWPRWTEDGLNFLVRQGLATPAQDTLAVVTANPSYPEGGISVRYRFTLSPDSSTADPVFTSISTYDLSVDGNQVIVAAQPDSGAVGHALYAGALGGPRIYRVLSNPAQFPVYPRLLR